MDIFREANFLCMYYTDIVVLQDMELFDHLKWELILIDECQRPIVATHFQKIKMLVADMKLLMVTGEAVVCFLNHLVSSLWCFHMYRSLFYFIWVKGVVNLPKSLIF